MSADLFKIVKPTCVNLLGSASLTPSSIPVCLQYLDELADVLHSHSEELPQLSPSLVSYIFFPVSSILQRNSASNIPDQILEKLLLVLGFLSESWWWHCEMAIWEQIFMLCGSVLGGMADKGKGKERDDEVKEAAAQCLYTLVRERNDNSLSAIGTQRGKSRLAEFQNYSRSPHFIPIFGQTFSAVLTTSESRSLALQRKSLEVLRTLLEVYAPDQIFPMILPGAVSTISKVALGQKLEKQWVNGDIVAGALLVMQIVIIRAIGDGICLEEGALRNVNDLEDLVELVTPSASQPREGSAKRTPSWLKGTASQLHIAINNLNTLTAHPSPAALRALASFAKHVLEETSQSLPQTQSLLLVVLLSMSNSSFPSVSSEACAYLAFLLSNSSKAYTSLHLTLMRNVSEYLSALPRLVSIQEESKVQHLAGLIEAVCKLAYAHNDIAVSSNAAIAKGIKKLLGPNGEIEKWGWSLLSVFEFSEAPIAVMHSSAEQLMLESDPDSSHWTPFPGLRLKNVGNDTMQALERMFRGLGGVGGEACLYSVEWFIGIGRAGTGRNAVAAMWCACRLLEGVSGINLTAEDGQSQVPRNTTRRLERLTRSLARILPELWDGQIEDTGDTLPQSNGPWDADDLSLVEHKKGLQPIHENLRIIKSSPATSLGNEDQPVNHRVITLQVLSVCAGVLQSRSSSLFIHILYPVLHSLVSQDPFLTSTAYASLQFMTVASSYASPANLLLSNFDYALDSISRRLTRRWLDVGATQVLVMLVRLVGSNVVEKAGDVVEECFDRLDEFHGYDVLVEGLVSVLTEVTKALESEVSSNAKRENDVAYTPYARVSDLSGFLKWYHKRNEHNTEFGNETDYGPTPRQAWGDETHRDEEPEENRMADTSNSNDELPPTPAQALTKQIVSRSLYFLIHSSPVIRARILVLLASSVPNLPASALMPAIHSAWPFILNRLGDQETFVVSAAASLVEALSMNMGGLMFRKIWDDVWPRFKTLLSQLHAGDAVSALVRRGEGTIGTESAYTHSHRLYRSLLGTMAAALQDVHPHEGSFWEVLVLFRKFLDKTVHPELQQYARTLYQAAMTQNSDVVWLVLTTTPVQDYPAMSFLHKNWDILENNHKILGNISAE